VKLQFRFRSPLRFSFLSNFGHAKSPAGAFPNEAAEFATAKSCGDFDSAGVDYNRLAGGRGRDGIGFERRLFVIFGGTVPHDLFQPLAGKHVVRKCFVLAGELRPHARE
jgi:hypothetical protein